MIGAIAGIVHPNTNISTINHVATDLKTVALFRYYVCYQGRHTYEVNYIAVLEPAAFVTKGH